MENNSVEHFKKFGYVTLVAAKSGATLDSYGFRPKSEEVAQAIAQLCNEGCNVQLALSVNDGAFFIHAVDPNRLGESQMPETMPTFQDFVADEIAHFVGLRIDQLSGDENPEFVLRKLREDIAEGNWKNYVEVVYRDRHKQ